MLQESDTEGDDRSPDGLQPDDLSLDSPDAPARVDAASGAKDAFGAGLGGFDDPFSESPLTMDTVSLDDPPAAPEQPRPATVPPVEAPQPAVAPPAPAAAAEATVLTEAPVVVEPVTAHASRAPDPAPFAAPPHQPVPAVARAPAPAPRVAVSRSEGSPSDAMSEAIGQATSVAELAAILQGVESWPWTPEQEAGIQRCKTYIPDKEVLAGFSVSSINEWRVSQPRVLVLTREAYYRVKYEPKSGKVEHYHKTALPELRLLEKTLTGVKVYLRSQDGHGGPKKWASWVAAKVSREKVRSDEFQHAREYLPALVGAGAEAPSADQVSDVLAAAFAKAAELLRADLPTGGVPFEPPAVLTTHERKQLVLDRKAAARAEEERAEREAAEAELRHAMVVAAASREREPKLSGEINHAVLARPLKRVRRAVDADAALVDEAEQLRAELEEELRDRLQAERLERERLEREAAAAELEAAVAYAARSRDASSLGHALRRAKKAVGVRAELLHQGEDLRAELEAEKRAEEIAVAEALRQRKLAERVERDKVESDAATAELHAAVGAAQASRDTLWLVKATRRARRAAGVGADLIERAESLKHEIDLEKQVAAEDARAAD